MIEEHLYKSNFMFGCMKYDLTELQKVFLSYLRDNTKPVFSWTPTPTKADLHGFHSDGISIHVQSTYLGDIGNYHIIDITLLSEVKSITVLEDKLKNLAEKHLRKR